MSKEKENPEEVSIEDLNTGLQAQVSELQEKNDELTEENESLKKRIKAKEDYAKKHKGQSIASAKSVEHQ
jgi:cell division septum initiation protein DivIVA